MTENTAGFATASRRGRWLEIEDRVFTEWRVRLYTLGVAGAWAFILSWLLLHGGWIIRPDGKLANIDFCWIWLSGKFAASSDPGRIYDPSIFATAQHIFYGPGECPLVLHQYDYPPTSLFFTHPLGLLPYLIAFAVWVPATLLLYAVAIYLIIPRPAAVIAGLTPVAVVANVVLGHNGFLTAGLIGLSLVFVERRPSLSGVFLGLLTYKPQYGVLFPLALLASRNWRALAGATAASLAFAAAAALAFGYRAWPSFIGSLAERDSGLSPDAGMVLKLHSVYGLLHSLGAAPWLSWTVHVAVAVVIASAVCIVWAKPTPYALKAAFLAVGSVIVSPYVLAYDLCILSISTGFLVQDGLSRGFLAGERTAIVMCFASLFLLLTPLKPIGPFVSAAIISLIGRRIILGYRNGLPSSGRSVPIGGSGSAYAGPVRR
jgi:hypothetical protein